MPRSENAEEVARNVLQFTYLHHTLGKKGVGVRLPAALAGHSHISTIQRYNEVNAEQWCVAVEIL
jgi:site-specific recombinase XerD